MKKIGTFKIETSFKITNRGIVAVCQHIDGIPKTGASTKIEFDGKILDAIITGVERGGRPSPDGIDRCGLLFKFYDDSLTERIATEKLKEQIIEVFVQ